MSKNKHLQKDEARLQDLKIFYGIPHCHTSYSTGKGTPTEVIEYAQKKGLDFIILTDHGGYLQDKVSYKEEFLSKWKALERYVRSFNKRNKNFLALRGFEAQTSNLGDVNILNSKSFFSGTVRRLESLLFWFIGSSSAIGGINHPHREILKLEYSKLLNEYIRYIEVGNGIYPDKYKKYDTIYYALLDKGWKLAPVNSQDNHKLNHGDSDNLTAVISEELDRKSIVKSIKALRVYSTESRSLRLKFTINNQIMGSTLDCSDKQALDFIIIAEDKINRIKGIDIISTGGKVVKSLKDINLTRVRYIFSIDSSPSENYYLAKIYMAGGQERIALSSPIFINR